MTRVLLPIYSAMPAPLRSLAASIRGYQLRSWRYGPETERLVQQARERETWSPERWRAWQSEQLAALLEHAARRVPYYREHWTRRRRRGDRSSWQYLENWPVLEKETLRRHPAAFLADGVNPRRMHHEHTSGTTGKPIDLWWSRPALRLWFALFEARWRRWYGVSRRDRWAIAAGQLVVPANRRKPPFWVWNAGLNQLYLSSYHLAPDLIPHYLGALERYQVVYLLGYASGLYALALEALRSGRRAPRMRVAITSAEPLFPYQRSAIAEAFSCPVRETYGMSEGVAAASECEHGSLHVWPEAGWIETWEDGLPVAPGRTGDLICTGLLNREMPLIRYRVGDRAAAPSYAARCPCGRTLPVIGGLEGRIDDVLYTADGRRIGRLDPVFKARLPIVEAQIVQETLDRVLVRYVPDGGFSGETRQAITGQLQARMGPVKVEFEQLDQIPRGANGKFRAVVCRIPLKGPDRLQ